MTTAATAQRLLDAGIEALQQGSAAAARTAFNSLIATHGPSFAAWLGLAYASANVGNEADAEAAVDQALLFEPRDLRALVLKADLLDRRKDPRAGSFYEAAVRSAPPDARLPTELLALLEHAQTRVNAYRSNFRARVHNGLLRRLGSGRTLSPRVGYSLDVLSGERAIYPSLPTLYQFPELPTIQFPDRAQFPWLAGLEARTVSIRQELLHVLQSEQGITPYLQAQPNQPRMNDSHLVGNPDWSAFHLWKDGTMLAENAQRCPLTMQALNELPLVRIGGRCPNVLFSILRPGARIPPHHGLMNIRLIGHLPLIAPAGCALRVGNETRAWEEGRAWLFDDTIEHEAWNHSTELRVVLLFEVWRPELNAAERADVVTLFDTIAAERDSV